MSSPVSSMFPTFRLPTAGALLQDHTKERGVSLGPRYELLWKGVHVYSEVAGGLVSALKYDLDSFTTLVGVADGDGPGKIRVFEREIVRQNGVAPNEWWLEINTQLMAFQKIRNWFPNPQKLSGFIHDGNFNIEPMFVARYLPHQEPCRSNPETAKIVATFPGMDESGLSEDQKSLLNQIVSGELSNLKTHEDLLLIEGPYRTLFDQKMKRVHRFIDGTVLYDCTAQALAKVEHYGEPECREFIALNGIRVMDQFQYDRECFGMPFSRCSPGYANYVVVRDGPHQSVVIERVELLYPNEIRAKKEICHVDLHPSNIVDPESKQLEYQPKFTGPAEDYLLYLKSSVSKILDGRCTRDLLPSESASQES